MPKTKTEKAGKPVPVEVVDAPVVEERDLEPQKKQVALIRAQVVGLVVTDGASQLEAVGVLSRVKTVQKAMEARKQEITAPLNKALRAVRALFAPMEASLDQAEASLKAKLGAYQERLEAGRRRQEKEQREAEAKIRAAEEAGRLKPATADRKVQALAQNAPVAPQETVRAANGGEVQFRDVRVVTVVEKGVIPAMYWTLDMAAVRRDALAGVSIPGVVVTVEKQIAAR